jgi:DNA-directed RNA polymerase subunit RPC12/RpoP
MAGGVCKRCGGHTTYTRQNSVVGLCFNCEHGIVYESPSDESYIVCPDCGGKIPDSRVPCAACGFDFEFWNKWMRCSSVLEKHQGKRN